MKLGVDLDGVVVEFAPYCDHWMTGTFGFKPGAINRWDWFTQYPDGELAFKAWWLACERTHLFLRMPAVQGALPALKTLKAAGHEVTFITHRPAWAELDTIGWLRNRGLGDCDIHIVEQPEDKAGIECDVYVDDYQPTIEHLLKLGRKAYLYSTSWNSGAYGIPMTYSWRHFQKLVGDLHLAAA